MEAVGWHRDAACAGEDPERFFSAEPVDVAFALSICAGCPVREPCLRLALVEPEVFGVWGGTTETERRRALRQRRRDRRSDAA